MEENIVIVESPAKAKTIEKFLGKNYLVKSSYGHIRDLSKKNLGIDLDKNYKPDYIIADDKKKIVAELKKFVKNADTIWLASDEDREGEAIAWHLYEVLKLSEDNTRRIVFHEITKEAIQRAIKNPRSINRNLVDAQQARRILDRLVGFELSPVLWKKVKPALSAGRVQSVAVRLIVDREREIQKFQPSSDFRITGIFEATHAKKNKKEFPAELSKRFKQPEEVKAFLQKCIGSEFTISGIVTKPSKKSPAPPFTTSTLQQEASRKLSFSVAQTMSIAQKLYEAGKITYMRTDSVNLASSAVNACKDLINKEFGEKYIKTRQYKTKAKGAQEAHEAIRPTYMENAEISGSYQEKRLYELIWKRTIASQMSDAELEKTTVTIDISKAPEKFTATGEVLKFEGFLKVYIESTDEDTDEQAKGLLPPLEKGENLIRHDISATERFTHHPPRYTEASLVKKLEELGIGRPSTYAPTISTIQHRGYVVKEDRPGKERKYKVFAILNDKIVEQQKTETTGTEKAKMFPTDVGMVVNDFLMENFKNIMDFNFTASVEKDFDQIAEGKLDWQKMIDQFYKPFHKQVEETIETSAKSKGERYLGDDPETGKPVSVKIGRYGPMVQLGDSENEEKPKFAGLLKGQKMDSITLEEALKLFKLPRSLGEYEDKEVVVGIGRFGPYVRHDSKFVSLEKNVDDPMSIELERAIELIEKKREKEKNKIIKKFNNDGELFILRGRYGPYISYNKENYRIPKGKDPEKLTYEEVKEIIEKSSKKKNKKK
ncbi:MAG: type I DNA topoisomerase [Bacteroidota bacterium]